MFAKLFIRSRSHLLNVQFECRHSHSLQIEFFKELFIDFVRIDLIDGHGQFEPIVDVELEFPSLFSEGLLLFLDFPLFLDDFCRLRHFVEGIVVSPVEEKDAGFFQMTEFKRVVFI